MKIFDQSKPGVSLVRIFVFEVVSLIVITVGICNIK